MGFLNTLFGGGNIALTAFLALVAVVVLIVLGLWLLKLLMRFTSNAGRGRNRRLSVIEATPLDQKRQLVLIRRDNVEHLIVTGGGTDLLIESSIPAIQPPVPQAARAQIEPVAAGAAQSASAASSNPAPAPRRGLGPLAALTEKVTRLSTTGGTKKSAPQPDAADATHTPAKSAHNDGPSTLGRLRAFAQSSVKKAPQSLRYTGLLRATDGTETAPETSGDAAPELPPAAKPARTAANDTLISSENAPEFLRTPAHEAPKPVAEANKADPAETDSANSDPIAAFDSAIKQTEKYSDEDRWGGHEEASEPNRGKSD